MNSQSLFPTPTYSLKYCALTLWLVSCPLLTLLAQGIENDSTLLVRGHVTGTTGKPLAGAIVLLASTSRGTPTDQHGNYLLTDVPPGATLVFSNVGYQLLMRTLPDAQRSEKLQVLDAVLELVREELPPMGATAAYKSIKLNKAMPAVATLPESLTQTGTAVEEKAYFPTGLPGLMHYVAHHLHEPAKAKRAKLTGDVLVQFTVTPTGHIDEVHVNKGIDPECDREALRVVGQMPKWIPGRQNGQPVSSAFVLPIRFALDD